MKSHDKLIIGLIAIVVTGLLSCSTPQNPDKGKTIDGLVFQLLNSNQTGVTFANNIVEDNQYNHLVWSHVYSGAGVAVGDINNDNLPDLYFSGNIVSDALYLNKGNMQFEEITDAAGLKRDGRWSTGVTFADVNQDGFQDIYVCRLGWTLNPNDRRNLLYINNGNNTFTEQASTYGLDDGGFSIQASFFDMDKDGDLDMFLANQPPDPRLLSRFGVDPEEDKQRWQDRLYQNDGNNKFKDISRAAGVDGHGYGLNVVASDLNGDNLIDLYVTNDYDGGDFLYMNNGDLTFTNTINESIKHISNFAMGSDVADYNNDGYLDILAVDMASADHVRSKTNMGSMSSTVFWNYVETGKHYQYMFNTLQKNNGNGTFSELGQIAGISKTDWSWGALMADFDNDAYKDIVVTNGIQRDIRNNDFQYKIKKFNEQGQRDFRVMDVVNLVPSNPISNFLFKNNGDLTFTNVSKDWGFDHPGFSHGIAYADFDLDGDIDLVINNNSAPASIYENKQGNRNNYVRFKLVSGKKDLVVLNAQVTVKQANQTQMHEATATRGFMSASEPVLHFGLGNNEKIEEVQVRWPNGKWTILKDVEANKTHVLRMEKAADTAPAKIKPAVVFKELAEDAGLDFVQKENDFDDFEREILIPHKQSQHGPHISKGDVNGDGLEDFFIGGAIGSSSVLFLQQQGGSFERAESQPWNNEKEKEDLGSVLFDADNDGDLDLYVVSGGSEFKPADKRYEDRFYRNDGKGNFSKTNGVIPKINVSGESVIAADFDADGDLDLFVGGRLVPGKYPAPADSYLLENNNGKFKDITEAKAPALRKLGLVTDAVFSDYDGDKDLDLIVVGEWMKISVFNNDGNEFTEETEDLGLDHSRAWWWSIEEGDFDKDGDMDYVLGNLGKNTKFKASDEKPFMVYGNDFDGNGSNDIVLANYYGDKVVPVRGRECTSQQMPFVADKFPTYEGFANASIENIYPEEELESAVKYEVHSFKSILLLNENGKFKKVYLPMEAQYAPLQDVAVLDIDKDGNLDILGVGNMYGAEVETMRYDAGIGVCLMGDGSGGFKPVDVSESGFFTPGDARSISVLNNGQNPTILVGNNGGKIQGFVKQQR